MIRVMIQSYILTFVIAMNSVAIEAPALTDKDFLNQIFINYGRMMPISVDGGQVEVEYIQEVDIEKWSQGKRIFFDYFLIPLNDGSRKPTPAKILNPDNQFVEVTEENSGSGKFFSKLNESHHDKMACKYQFTIPHLAAKTLPNEFQKRTYYPAVQETNFIVYLIADKDDLLNPSVDDMFLEPTRLGYDNTHTFASSHSIPQPVVVPTPVATPVKAPTPVVTPMPPSLPPSSTMTLGHGSACEIKIHKGKKWIFKGSTPIRPL
jgi:hypothetical protein